MALGILQKTWSLSPILVEEIQQEQGTTENLVENVRAQENARAPSGVYQDLQKRLFDLVIHYPKNGVLRFLKNVAHNIMLKRSIISP